MSAGKDKIRKLAAVANRYNLSYAMVSDGETEIAIEFARSSSTPARTQIPAAPTALEIKSGFVGYFRHSVPLGSAVSSGTPIGIVEALGLPNDVVAANAGTLVELLVDDGQPVEYGQPVARVETAK
ncbi:MAG TPA: biotin/lipoyl-containing protein [Fimbriimonadales bacterium]|jgi:acetyl-CoA carboxylase biotin carboxyl carrier protein|nr:biotin/lipoyl-containing protein [Fimbriimonadales bacterium]